VSDGNLTERSGETPRLLLASASPRRRELLALLGVRYSVVVSRFDEGTLAHLTDPVEYVRTAAESKAEEVARRHSDCFVIGVDTDVVAPDGTILGKPQDAADARRLLRSLSGQTHSVYSGVALLQADRAGSILRRDVRVEETRVTFADLPDAAIDAYIATGEPWTRRAPMAFRAGRWPS
jgi:septum formation protein